MEALSKGSGYVWATDEIRLLTVLFYPNPDEVISTYNGIYFSGRGQHNNIVNQVTFTVFIMPQRARCKTTLQRNNKIIDWQQKSIWYDW